MPTLGVFVCDRDSFHLDIIRGASRHGISLGWQAQVCQDHLYLGADGLADLIRRNRSDAYIVQGVDHAPLSTAFAATGRPVIQVTARSPGHHGPMVTVDHQSIGRHAARHLLERGFRSFAYIGWRDAFWSVGRMMGCHDILGSAGRTLSTFFIDSDALNQRGWHHPNWSEPFLAFIDQRPRPLAIIAHNDPLAAQVARLLHDRGDVMGSRVPEDIAVLGTDNDAFVCETVLPPLSSVRQPGVAIGIEAARMAMRLLAGDPVPATDLLMPALGVELRRSTDITAVADPALASALRHLRDHWREADALSALVGVSGLSRRTLERRFSRHFGRSARAELRRLRLDHAHGLLIDTPRDIGLIAHDCGFLSVSAFCRAFREDTGESPGALRARHHGAKI